MAVLLVSPKDIDLVTITGDLSPLDLLHLRGHFGIPKFDADNLVPAPASAPPASAPQFRRRLSPRRRQPHPAVRVLPPASSAHRFYPGEGIRRSFYRFTRRCFVKLSRSPLQGA